MEIDSIIDIKRKNVKSIIDFARFQDVWQKRDAARELNLSFATVSNIINVLMECGLMEQTEVSLKAVGARLKRIAWCRDALSLLPWISIRPTR